MTEHIVAYLMDVLRAPVVGHGHPSLAYLEWLVLCVMVDEWERADEYRDFWWWN
jgi:hypothetical protein